MTLEVRDTTLDKVGDPTPVVGCRREAQVVVSVYEAKDLKHKVPPGVSVQLEVRCSCGTLSTARAATSQEGWAVFVIPEGSCAIASWALVVDHDRDPWVLTGPLRDNEIAFGSLTALHVVRPRGILQVGEVPAFETRALAEGDPPPQTLRISNVGNSALVLESVTVPAGVFRLSSEERRTKVRPGAAVDIQVEATPTATDAVQTATVTVVSSVGNGTAELRASAYELRTLVANVSPIAPDVDDADIHYTIEDPGGGVGRATISIHEIDPTSGAIGREIASFDGQPHAAGDNTFSWKGAVTHRDYQYGSVMSRGSAYRAKLIIARADGGGPRELTCDVAIKDVGELMIRLERHDGAALAGRATFEVKNVDSDAVVNATTQALTTPNREEIVVKGLEPGNYEVRLQNKDAYLAADGLARVAPDRAGVARVRVKVRERIRVPFELTPYTKVQLVGFHATPTGTNATAPGALADYKGEPDDRQDMLARCEIMKQAMSMAQADTSIDTDAGVLKVFMAPEFFFRGKGGGYPLDLVAEILPELLQEAQDPKYADWLFVYGTAIGYLRHGDGTPDVYGLRITANPGALPQRVRIKANPALPSHQQCSVAVCKRIPPGNNAPVDWKLRRGATTASIRLSTRVSDDEYELVLSPAAPAMGVGPVELVEPESTEVFNTALVQRGGPSPGGTRDRLVAKEYVSSIDFLGQHHPLTGGDFYAGIPRHRADIHHTGDRLILATEGSSDPSNAPGTRNPVATGGTTEHDKSGLGGGGLFSMAGINFGMEVCLDHAQRRLMTAVEHASPGDPKPQVHLIPSWGMSIAGGPIYTVANGLVFNVDGRPAQMPEAGTFTGQYRCPDHVHNAATHAPPTVACPSPHYRCPTGHPHFEAGANCSCCGGPLVAAVQCSLAQHLFLDNECTLCGRKGLPEVARNCPTCGVVPTAPCPTCAHATEPVYGCDAPVYRVAGGTCCGAAMTPVTLSVCPAGHPHAEYAPGNCTHCTAALAPQQRKLQNDWTPLVPIVASVPVPDPTVGRLVNQQTVTTTVVVTPNDSAVVTSETTTRTPANTPPLPIPTTVPAVDNTINPGTNVVRRVRHWPGLPFRISSVEDETTDVGATETTKTTVVTTTRTGTVYGRWANLFANPGALRIYSARDVPEAEVV